MSIDLFSADFSRLGDADLFEVISDFTRQSLPQQDRTQEGYTIDFKEKWTDKALREVAAFANTFGGLIFVGVSEEGGRAKDLVGEESKREIKTRLASSIASNISPCPNFDIAECLVPGRPDRRIAVIRVRSTNRIHFLMVKYHTPVYIRNEDEATPARAAELRSLIQRERESESSAPMILDQSRLLNLLPVTKRTDTDDGMGPKAVRTAATSYFRVWVIPNQTWKVDPDYDMELTFRDTVFSIFPNDSFAEDIEWNTSEDIVRDKDYVRINYAHVQRDLESKWAFTNGGEFGYATLFAEGIPPAGLLWSLSDLTLELHAAISAAHALLARTGYLGEMSIHMFADPGGGSLYEQRGELPFIRHASGNRAAPVTLWPQIVPKRSKIPESREIAAFASSNFTNRTAALDELVADLLNQLLRSLGQGAIMGKLQEFVAQVAKLGKRVDTVQ
jgi:hypothetical protein